VTPLAASARMYAVAPDAAAAWARFFTWLAAASGVPLTLVEHAYPAPLADLWARPDLGATFMCGWPLSGEAPGRPILAAPVPAADWAAGRPIYRTDFVTRADAPFVSLEDALSGRLGFTAETSWSGGIAPSRHLTSRGLAFRQRIGSLVTPRRAAEAVRDGTVDVAPLDSYAHELLRRYDPALAGTLRVLEATCAAPIPPLVASHSAPERAVRALRSTLLGGLPAEIAAPLGLVGFDAVGRKDYAAAMGEEGRPGLRPGPAGA